MWGNINLIPKAISIASAFQLGVTPLRAFLKGHIAGLRSIAASSFIIWKIIRPYAESAGEVFSWLERTGHSAVTSTITMTEVPFPSTRTLRGMKRSSINLTDYYSHSTPNSRMGYRPIS